MLQTLKGGDTHRNKQLLQRTKIKTNDRNKLLILLRYLMSANIKINIKMLFKEVY